MRSFASLRMTNATELAKKVHVSWREIGITNKTVLFALNCNT